ncbi:MAG: hypothetical protein ALAOOOJD_01024 [bacterium]|nr:hypothetical protein [bacterium]
MYLQRVANLQRRIRHRGSKAGCAGQNLHMMRKPGGYADGAAVIVGSACMIRCDNAAARCRQSQRRADACRRRHRADTAADTPIHRHIRNIIAIGIIAGRVHRQCLIRGQTLAAHLIAGAVRPFYNFDIAKRGGADGYSARGVVKKRGVIGQDDAGAGRGRRQRRADA